MPEQEEKSFSGWGPLKFGMSFDDALTAYPGFLWDAVSVGRCRAEMALGGCTLKQAKEPGVALIAGIAMHPTLIFNQAGKLATIRLGKLQRGKVGRAQCERAYGQLSSNLHHTSGSPAASPLDSLEVTNRSNRGSLDFFPATNKGAVVGRETLHAHPDGRAITLLGSYFGKTSSTPAACYLSIEYRGPQALQPPPEERPYPLKNWH